MLEIDWYISDLPLFLIDNTRYESVAVFQNTHQSKKVVDKKESSTKKSCRQQSDNIFSCVSIA